MGTNDSDIPTFLVGSGGIREDRNAPDLTETLCAGQMFVVSGQGWFAFSADPFISYPSLLVEGTQFSGTAILLGNQWNGEVELTNEGCLDSKDFPLHRFGSNTFLCKKVSSPYLCGMLSPALVPVLGPMSLLWAYVVGHLQIPLAFSLDEPSYSWEVTELTIEH